MESSLFFILLCSILFQLAAAVYSLYLIKYTGFKYSWVFISAALLLMSVRRAIPLSYIITNENFYLDTINEVIGLVLSILMLVGIRGVGKIFIEKKLTEDKINSLLNEKDLILKEVHHRIKNNMNTTYGLIVLQAESVKEPEAKKALDDASNRVQAMITLYEELFISGKYSSVSMNKYLPMLAERIIANFPHRENVILNVISDEFELDEKKLSSLGLIINELLTNIMKYAFTGRESGNINITLSGNKNRAVLVVNDDGVGFSEEKVLTKQSGFGLSLVEMLTNQLNGKISFKNENGVKVILAFDI